MFILIFNAMFIYHMMVTITLYKIIFMTEIDDCVDLSRVYLTVKHAGSVAIRTCNTINPYAAGC